jgi:general secretion pathway protein B
MSYILDALKRSEDERQRRRPSATEMLAAPGARKGRSPWLAVAVAAVVLNAALGGWYLWHESAATAQRAMAPAADNRATPAEPNTARTDSSAHEQKPSPGRDKRTAPKEEAASASTVAMNDKPLTAPASREPGTAPPPPEHKADAATSKTAGDPRKRDTAKTASAKPSQDAGEPAPEKAAAKASKTTRVPLLAELPASFRQSLPRLTVNIHVYSPKPASRFVLVDMKRYREGQTLDGGIRLERITPDGMVLQWQGRRFLMTLR